MERLDNGPLMNIRHDGLELNGPSKPHRGAYIRVSVIVVDPRGRTVSQAWDAANRLAFDTYGTTSTEDGTVGQAAQTRAGGDPVQPGKVFSLGLNLYYHRQRDVLARIAAMKANSQGGA